MSWFLGTRGRPLLLLGLIAVGLGAGLLGYPIAAEAQRVPAGDVRDAYLRVLETTGRAQALQRGVNPLYLERGYAAVNDTVRHPWQDGLRPPLTRELGSGAALTLADPGVRVTWNNKRPHGENEGPLWSGRGMNLTADERATLRWGPVEATLHPVFTWSENRDFEMAPVFFEGVTPYHYPWRHIDLPQRFGPDPVATLHLGESALRLHLRSAEVGVTTENLWWGPALRYPIVMSNNAPGFPHAYLATGHPVGVGVGTLQARWIFGRLRQSAWFEDSGEDPGRYLTGAVVAFHPGRAENLTLGVTRVFYATVPDDGIPLREAFVVFQGVRKAAMADEENPLGDDERSQMASLFARWVLPASNTEIWGEWARNDHGWDLRDYVLQPEHASALTLGLRHVVELSGDRLLALESEVTRLEQTRTQILRDSPTWYAHSLVLPGYTHRGKVLGAALGPGGSAQHLAADLYAHWGRAGAFVRRRVRDNDAYYFGQIQSGEGNFSAHNVLVDFGGRGLTRVSEWELEGTTTFTWELNPQFRTAKYDWLLNLAFSARWRPR